MSRNLFGSTITAGAAALAIFVAPASRALAGSVTITCDKDNSLIQPTTMGDVSNALGDLFSGRTGSMGGNAPLRAVMHFNVAGSIPAGATITGVSLNLVVLLEPILNPGPQSHALHRLTADWGEGTSSSTTGQGAPATPGDATWNHRFFPRQFWTTPGGDFVAAPSATKIADDPGTTVTWSSATMIADVQGWLDSPATNFGWVLIGNEAATTTARLFGSSENTMPENRPALVIEFTPPPCPGDCAQPLDGVVNVTDLLALVAMWGAAGGNGPCDIVPPGGNGVVNVSDLLELVANWGPC